MPEWILKPTNQYKLPVVRRHETEQHEIGPLSNVARLMWWSTVRASLKMMHRLEIDGREHLPEAPSFVLVANHTSHLDALVLGSVLPLRYRNQLFPVAAGDVFFQSPARAAFSTTVLNAIPLSRKQCGAHAIRKLRDQLLEESRIYILFPEGGRSRDGHLHHFKSGIGMITAQTSVPVVPCYLREPMKHSLRIELCLDLEKSGCASAGHASFLHILTAGRDGTRLPKHSNRTFARLRNLCKAATIGRVDLLRMEGNILQPDHPLTIKKHSEPARWNPCSNR